jgi:hypothetical protein
LSFSKAGWFCKFGRRALNRPVSVFIFKEQWILPEIYEILPLGSICSYKGKINVFNKV